MRCDFLRPNTAKFQKYSIDTIKKNQKIRNYGYKNSFTDKILEIDDALLAYEKLERTYRNPTRLQDFAIVIIDRSMLELEKIKIKIKINRLKG